MNDSARRKAERACLGRTPAELKQMIDDATERSGQTRWSSQTRLDVFKIFYANALLAQALVNFLTPEQAEDLGKDLVDGLVAVDMGIEHGELQELDELQAGQSRLISRLADTLLAGSIKSDLRGS